MQNLTIRDPELRSKQYVRAIKWWSRVSDSQGWSLCVVENSGSLESLREQSPPETRWLSVPIQQEEEIQQGKGAGEARMLLEASRHWSEFDYLIKVTGRLRVINVISLVREMNKQSGKEIAISPGQQFHRVDTRFFIAPPSAIEQWMSAVAPAIWDEDGSDLEAVSAQWLMSNANRHWNVELVRRTPAFVGTSGTTGIRFSPSRAYGRVFLESLLDARISK